MEHCFADAVSQNLPKQEAESDKWNSAASSFSPSGGEISNPSSGFDCNICLDSVQDPVVTLCGHLYCWPCIYKWINVQSNSNNSSSEMFVPPQQAPQCPVCKSEISESSLVPLYALNSSLNHHNSDDDNNKNSCIPSRPKGPSSPPLTPRQLAVHPPPTPTPYGAAEFTFSSPSQSAISLAGSTTFHPVIDMFGELLCGSPQQQHSLLSYMNTHPGSYSVAATSNPRARRQVVQADRSLSRLSFFLCCCLVLCLLLF